MVSPLTSELCFTLFFLFLCLRPGLSLSSAPLVVLPVLGVVLVLLCFVDSLIVDALVVWSCVAASLCALDDEAIVLMYIPVSLVAVLCAVDILCATDAIADALGVCHRAWRTG